MADWLHPADREPREYRSSPPHIFVSNAFEATFSTVNFFNKKKQWTKWKHTHHPPVTCPSHPWILVEPVQRLIFRLATGMIMHIRKTFSPQGRSNLFLRVQTLDTSVYCQLKGNGRGVEDFFVPFEGKNDRTGRTERNFTDWPTNHLRGTDICLACFCLSVSVLCYEN